MKTTTECQTCKKSFEAENRELNRGNAKYCSLSCAGKAPKQLQFKTICKHCGKEFQSASRSARYCSISCKQKYYRFKSKGDKSMKSFNKDFKDIPCEICNWKETTRDLHHIIHVSKGGKNTKDNLISVCPNHHRMIHNNLISENTLFKYIEYRTISSSYEL